LGVFRTKPIEFSEFLSIKGKAEDLAADLPYIIDLVNLTAANREFLSAIIKDAFWVGGPCSPWADLVQTLGLPPAAVGTQSN
jgi:hypothetical protein